MNKSATFKEMDDWKMKQKFAEVENAYKRETKKKKILEEKESTRVDLSKQLQQLEKSIQRAKRAGIQLQTVRMKRQTLISELKQLRAQYSEERRQQAEIITARSGEKLRINLMIAADTANYTDALSKLKIGSRAEKVDVEKIIANVAPDSLIDLLLDNDSSTLAKTAGISVQMARNIIDELGSPENIARALSLQYAALPDDRIDIQYLKADRNYYPLSELSMGQKADALVMIALGDGTAPVAIDQPEDALDLPSIWSDICKRIRVAKHGRQFVFTTHNSSISVASDSDEFTILEADGTTGRVARTGSIDQQPVRELIVGHLEGGRDSYDLKRRKYGF